MNVWIDMDNSPHVPLLMPFIQKLSSQGHGVFITARDYAQTIDLIKKEDVDFRQIGKHSGASKLGKILGLLHRTGLLLRFAKGKKINLAISHGSRAQAVACKLLNIPCYIGMDYEHTESRIFSRCAAKIWLPQMLYPTSLPFIGVSKNRVICYNGIKEQFYLNHFTPDPSFKESLDIPSDKILVVLRPPAESANYHNERSEVFVTNIIQRLLRRDDVYTICTPRTTQQKRKLKSYESPLFKVLERTVDGKNLVYYADTMISGGGTMNREAAFFGAHVYSIFSGKKPMLDVELEKMGLLSFVTSAEDCNGIQFTKKHVNGSSSIRCEPNELERLLKSILQDVIKRS